MELGVDLLRVGAAAGVAGVARRTAVTEHGRVGTPPIDCIGAITLPIGIGTLVFGIIEGDERGFAALIVVGSFAVRVANLAT